MSDVVNEPPHYTQQVPGVEMTDVAEHFGFCLGNVIKYVWRAGAKNDTLEDLRKARWYLDREISRIEATREALRAQLVRGIEEQFNTAPPVYGSSDYDVKIPDRPVESPAQWSVHNPDGTSRTVDVPPVQRWHE